jgi:hypothetical protein
MTSPPIITEDPQVISDVEQAVKEFQNKQHIPNFVAEASLFKKPYFGHFLQHLLFCELVSSEVDTLQITSCYMNLDRVPVLLSVLYEPGPCSCSLVCAV